MEKRFKLTCIGCQMNKSDSERIIAYLSQYGYFQAEKNQKCNLLIYVTCGVRQSAEDRVYGLIPNDRRANPGARVVLTGCLALRPDVREKLAGSVDIWMDIKELPRLYDLLRGMEKSQTIRDCDYLKQNPSYSSDFSAFVPIGNGCDNFCSYCVVPFARGRESYRNAQEIIEETQNLLKRGYKEISLIAQNVNSYRCPDTGLDFAGLLLAVDALSDAYWLRFTTSHPKDMSDKLIKAMAQCRNLCHHLHLPAQAGDDEILRSMNRRYTKKDYLSLLSKVRSALPDILVSTDIIVGFPGESLEQFEETVQLFREANFDMAYIAQYSPRPGTAAASLKDDVSSEEKKRREEALTTILRESARRNSQALLGKEVLVLINEKNKKGELFGKTQSNKSVKILNPGSCQIGNIVKILIKEAQDFGVAGEPR